MTFMFVTREMFQLSGWLKAYACCRGSEGRKQGTRCGAGCGPGGGRRRVNAACTQHAGESARGAQRTSNMWFMSVTRDVSQPEMSASKLRMRLKR